MAGSATSESAQVICKILKAGRRHVTIKFSIIYRTEYLVLIRKGPLKPYINKARWISQSVHPFISILRVFYAGIPEAIQDDTDDEDKYVNPIFLKCMCIE